MHSRVLRSADHMMMWALDELVRFRRRKSSSDVLVVFHYLLGDFVLWLDAAREFRSCFPRRRLILLVSEAWAPLARHVGLWDEVWPFSPVRFLEDGPYRRALMGRVRAAGFETVVNSTREFRLSDSIVRLSGAREKICTSADETVNGVTWALRLAESWYTRVVTLRPRRESTALENNLKLPVALGAMPRRPQLPRIPVAGLPDLAPALRGRRYAVFVVGASERQRCWPVESFARLGREIWQRHGLEIAITGAAGDRELGAALEEGLADVPTHNRVGRTDLLELASTLAHASVVVANETGAMHLSVALQGPTVCLLGGGDFGYNAPYSEGEILEPGMVTKMIFERMSCYGCRWVCSHEDFDGKTFPCIKRLAVASVAEAVAGLLPAGEPRVGVTS